MENIRVSLCDTGIRNTRVDSSGCSPEYSQSFLTTSFPFFQGLGLIFDAAHQFSLEGSKIRLSEMGPEIVEF